MQGAQVWITQYYLQLHQCLPLPRKRSPDNASPDLSCRHLIAAYYSFRPTERARGPPQKNLSWCEKRWKRAGRNREVKNCSSDTTCLQLPSGIQDLHVLLDDCQKSQTRPKSVESKKQDYFKGVFFWIISLYCIVILDFSSVCFNSPLKVGKKKFRDTKV